MFNPVRLLALFFSVGLISINAQAADDLRYRWDEGETYILTKIVSGQGSVKTDDMPPLRSSQRAIIQKKVDVLKVDPLGVAQLHVALLTVSGTREIDGEEVRYSINPDEYTVNDLRLWKDSGDSASQNPKVAQMMREIFKPWVVWCAPRGQSSNPNQPETIRQETSHSDLFSLFGLGQEGWITLPDEGSPLQSGTSWKDALAEPARSGTAEVWQSTDYKIEKLEQGKVIIAFHQKKKNCNLPLSYAPRIKDQSKTTHAFYRENEQDFSGTVEFNMNEGRVIGCDCRGSARIDYRLDDPAIFGEAPFGIHNQWDIIQMKTTWEKVENN